jgi:hypothetical protein
MLKNPTQLADQQIHQIDAESQRLLIEKYVLTCLFHYKNPTEHVCLVQSGPHHHLIEN